MDVHQREFLDIPSFLDLVVEVDEVARCEDERRSLAVCGGVVGCGGCVCGGGRLFFFFCMKQGCAEKPAEETGENKGGCGSL